MNLRDERKKQLKISSLADLLDSGTIDFEKDPRSYVNGPKDMDCLVDKWARKEVLGIIAGSGAGKTQLTLTIIRDVLESNPDQIAIFTSLEMVTKKIAERWVNLVGRGSELTSRLYIISNYELEDDKAKNLTTDGILREAQMYKEALGQDICIMAIDHLHLISPTKDQGQDFNRISQSVKSVAVELDCFMILLSQTTKGKSGPLCDKSLDADASFNCSQFKWISSYVITIHQPIAAVFDVYKLPVLAWAYWKVREKNIEDGATCGVYKLLKYDMDNGSLRPLAANEMITFTAAYGEVLEMKREEENDSMALYDTKIKGKTISERDRMLGDTYADGATSKAKEDAPKSSRRRR